MPSPRRAPLLIGLLVAISGLLSLVAVYVLFSNHPPFAQSSEVELPQSEQEQSGVLDAMESAPEFDNEEPMSVSAPVQLEAIPSDDVTSVLPEVIEKTSSVLATPEQEFDLSEVFAETALEGLQAEAAELETLGLHQEGSPTVENPQIVSSEGEDGPLVLSACIDSSSVKYLNEDGEEPTTGSESPQRSLMLFTFVRRDGHWLLTYQTFPEDEDPDC